MTFKWTTKDGKRHEKTIPDDEEHYQDRIDFIRWLETDPNIIRWR